MDIFGDTLYKTGEYIRFHHSYLNGENVILTGKILIAIPRAQYEEWYVVDVNNKCFQVRVKDIIRIATSEDIFLCIMEGDFKP